MNIVSPESVGFSSARLARINTVMQRYVDERKLAGMVTLVARRGQTVHFETCGVADIATGVPMRHDTLFRIYSMTKPITSAAVLMLFEEGRFQLSDPVARYIPAFADVKVLDNSTGSGVRYVAPVRPISIRDLLTHTAGLSYGFDENVYIDDLYREQVYRLRETSPDMTLEDFVQVIATLPLAHQPGSAFRYSFATDVLGLLVQVIAGMPFEEFLRQRIFEPLGMGDTGFYVPAEQIGRFAATHGPDLEHGLAVTDAPATSDFARPTRLPSGGGGLVSSTSDYLRFAQMLLNQGELEGERLLGSKTVELMASNHLPTGVHPFDDTFSGFGLGVSVLLDPAQAQNLGSVGTFGWGGAANTNFWIDPREQLIGILMLQFMPSDTYPVSPNFRTLVYQALVD
ncbi:MAG: beta-lactamase family protein [Chloroflexota bacterium]|nr:beta-lactamase family protein [Chloroflexota bacterium]